VGNPFRSSQCVASTGCNPLNATDNNMLVFKAAKCDPMIWSLVAQLIPLYTNQQTFLVQTAGSTDFRTFIAQGYPGGGVVESNIYENGLVNAPTGYGHHTVNDLIAFVDVDYVTQFCKLAVSFAVEASDNLASTSTTSDSKSSITIILIIVGVVGGILLVIAVAVAIVLILQRRRHAETSAYQHMAM